MTIQDQNEARDIATQVYQSLSRAPQNIQGWQNNPSLPQFAPISTGPTGVLTAVQTAGQTVGVTSPGNTMLTNLFSLPIPVIYGSSSFNGGTAPPGSSILFVNNGGTLKIQLWMRIYDPSSTAQKWYGIDFSPTNAGGNAKVLGPLT